MAEWIQRAFDAPEFSAAILPAALLLGVLTAVGSGCNLAIIAGVAGFAGSRQDSSRRDAVVACACFALGTIVSMALVGSLAGYVGRATGGRWGVYGKAAAGIVIILFGLAALQLLPFRLPRLSFLERRRPRGLLASGVFGLAVGGASIACTMVCCGPLLPVVLGLAVLRGQAVWGALIMGCFTVGYTLPLAGAMLGVSLGRLSGAARQVAGPLRVAAGLVLVGVGFWMLATL
ncbi:MAG: cytochrome c biogenesis CcdA family protein [Planctomycetota bacterium]